MVKNQHPQSNVLLESKRLLILGGSQLQLPAIIEAKNLGLVTAVLDYNYNCPGRTLADKFYLESTNDEEAVYECAKDFKADGIITLGTDWPIRSVAYASEKLNLNSISYESACIATNKYKMRTVLSKSNLGHPKFFHFNPKVDILEDIIDDIPYPCIIKPVDSSGSRGVILLENESKLNESVEYSSKNSKSGEVMIEEYMIGPEVSVEIIILCGEPQVLSITDKTTTGFPYFVEIMHTEPSLLPELMQTEINKLAIESCRQLNLNTGAAHVEIIYTKDGPKIVEIGPRMGGDYITTHLVPLSTGINMTQLLILESLGLNPIIRDRKKAASCIKYIQSLGTFNGIQNIDEIKEMKNVIDIQSLVELGTKVTQLKSSLDRIGYIITQGETVEEAVMHNEAAHKKIVMKVN